MRSFHFLYIQSIVHCFLKKSIFFLSFIAILLPGAVMAQLDNYPFITLEVRDWLIKKNFDTDFYRGDDSLINVHLAEAVQKHKDPFMEFLIELNGGSESEASFKNIRLATLRRYDQLLKGQTFTGIERFRQENQAAWYRKENFYVDRYDGQSTEINSLLNDAYKWRNKSNNHWEAAAATNVGGLGMVLIGAFSAAFGAYDASQGWLLGGTLVHFSSYVFASSAIVRKDKSRAALNKASRLWFKKLNSKK